MTAPPRTRAERATTSAVRALSALALLAAAAPAAAQDALPELNSLRPSSAPAFILLGVAPASVERPQTPADLGLSFVNQTRSFTALPQNYAAEVAPYWLLPQRTLGWRDDVDRGMGTSFARTATLSFGTAQVGTDAAPVTGIAFGGSAYLISGRMSDAAQDRMRAIEAYLAARDSLESALAAASLLAVQQELGAQITAAAQRGDTAAVRQLTLAVTTRVDAARQAAQLDSAFRQWEENHPLDQLQEATPRREGLFWGVAGGASWGFPDATWEAGRIRTFGVWTTLSYEGTQVGSGTTFTPLAVVRLLGSRGDSAATTLDAGGRFVLSGPAYSASVEGVVRLPIEDAGAENLYRVAGIVEYRVQPDLWLTATFGRDYRSAETGSLIAQLGLKFHVTGDRYAPPAADGG